MLTIFNKDMKVCTECIVLAFRWDMKVTIMEFMHLKAAKGSNAYRVKTGMQVYNNLQIKAIPEYKYQPKVTNFFQTRLPPKQK